jgi:uncharacterized protein with GYD domain
LTAGLVCPRRDRASPPSSAFEAPDDESVAALAFSTSSLGNTRAEILRAFSFEEMSGILAKMV